MSATPSITAGGATSTIASDAVPIDMAVTKIASEQGDTRPVCPTDSLPSPVSRPMDPDTPSLLTLPCEVRNAIYEALFIREDPIQIHANGFDPLAYHSGSVVLGTALLQSCRQIQHEATGVFYARNVFRLVLPEYADNDERFPWSMDWLRTVGKQSSSLRVLQLDISKTLDVRDDLDVLPILKYTWKLEHKDISVSFVTPPEKLSMGFQFNPQWSANDTANINKSLSALIADPGNLLRKYWAVNMLSKVRIDTNGAVVDVSYRQNHLDGDTWMSKGYMTISNEGELHMVSRDRKPDFYEVLAVDSVERSLLNLIQPPGVVPTFDLTNQATNINMKSLTGVNAWLRRKIIWEVSDYHSTFKSTTSTPKYNFTTELERFRAIRLRGCPRYYHLYFDLPKDFFLDDIRFDALPLLFAMSSVTMSMPDHDLHLKIEVRHSLDPQTPNQTFTLLLSELKTGVLYFIYKFLETYPERAHLPCPSIWTNGWGQAKEATWEDKLGLEPLDNEYLDNSHGVVRWIGNKLANDWASKTTSFVGPRVEGTLFEFLREVSWW